MATKTVYGCQRNVLYEPVPLLNNDHFGAAISFTGDWNGDGYQDQVIGGHNDATKLLSSGLPDMSPSLSRAALYLGGHSGMATTPVLTFNGNGTRDQFGERVGFLSDLTGDGRDELVVTAPNWPNQSTRYGRVYVFYGRAEETYTPGSTFVAAQCASFIIQGDVEGQRFGDAFASSRDLNPDAASDFLIGAPGSNVTDDDGLGYSGQVYGFFGATLASLVPAGPTPPCNPPVLLYASIADQVLCGEDQDDRFGHALAIMGNIDTDAGFEFAVGAPQVKLDSGLPRNMDGPGYVKVFDYANTCAGVIPKTLQGEQGAPPDDKSLGEAFGFALASGVDIGGGAGGLPDTINDLFVGAILFDVERGVSTPTIDAGAVHVFSGANFSMRLLPGVDPPGPAEAEVTRLFGTKDMMFYGFSIATMADIVGVPFAGIPDIVVGSVRDGSENSVETVCPPILGTPWPTTEQAGLLSGTVRIIDGATPDGTPHFLIFGERPRDGLGFEVAAGAYDGNGIAIVSAGLRWSDPEFEACVPLDPVLCPRETGRVYVFYADALNAIP